MLPRCGLLIATNFTRPAVIFSRKYKYENLFTGRTFTPYTGYWNWYMRTVINLHGLVRVFFRTVITDITWQGLWSRG